jgi:microcompartment protein CcmL/EutN
MIETRGLVASIEAADVMLKTANVTLLGKEVVAEGLVTVKVAGEVAAVTAAVDAARAAVPRVGELIAAHVIPRLADDIEPLIRSSEPGPAKTPSPHPPAPPRRPERAAPPAGTRTDLDSMTVHELRTLARQTPGLRIAGREISRANKTDLLQELERARKTP